jgi:hypothetical protein
MTQQVIINTPAGSGLGDSATVAFGKVNNNFTQLFSGTIPGNPATGAVVIGPPTGIVTALTVNAQVAAAGLVVNGATTAFGLFNASASNSAAYIGFEQAGSLLGRVGIDGSNLMLTDSVNGDLCSVSTGDSIRWGQFGGATQMSISHTGAVTIATPSALVSSLTVAGSNGNFGITINGANGNLGGALQLNGNFTGAGTISLMSMADPNNSSGVNIQMVGNGSVTPTKYLRVQAGNFQIMSSGYSAIFGLTDAGNATLTPSSGIGLMITGASVGSPLQVIPASGIVGIMVTGTDIAVITPNSLNNTFRSIFSFAQGGTGSSRIGSDGSQQITSDSVNGDLCFSNTNGGTIRWLAAPSGTQIASQMSLNQSGNLKLSGSASIEATVAVPAGGTTGAGLQFSTTTNLGVFFGSGLPTLSAAQGSLYIRTDGSSNSTRLYVNTNGTTGWTNFTSAT